MTEDLEDRLSADVKRALEAFPSPGRTDGKIYLVPSEISVFRLVGLGLTNEEIAARRFISPLTVRDHLKKIYDKCYIKGRSRLALVSCYIWHMKPESRRELSTPPKG